MTKPYFVCTKCGHCFEGEPHNMIRQTVPPMACSMEIYVCDDCIPTVFDDLNAMAASDIAIPKPEIAVMKGGEANAAGYPFGRPGRRSR